jgi:VIT1/CCC1 family predicted Fe2+/Mn2+ transporter
MVFGPASIFSGVLLIALVFLRPEHSLQNFIVSLGLFVLSSGISAICIVKGTDIKINKAITKASR